MRPGLRPENLNLKPEKPNLRPERPGLRPEKLDLRPERPNLRSQRPDLRPEGPDGGRNKRTNEQTNKRKNKSPPVFYRTSSPLGPLPKKEKIPHMCESFGHQPLRGCCSKRGPTDKPTDGPPKENERKFWEILAVTSQKT